MPEFTYGKLAVLYNSPQGDWGWIDNTNAEIFNDAEVCETIIKLYKSYAERGSNGLPAGSTLSEIRLCVWFEPDRQIYHAANEGQN